MLVEAGSMHSLAHVAGHVQANDGLSGRKRNLNGDSGSSAVILVPRGVVVRELMTGEQLADLDQLGQSVVVARGGRGGLGVAAKKSFLHRNEATLWPAPTSPPPGRRAKTDALSWS